VFVSVQQILTYIFFVIQEIADKRQHTNLKQQFELIECKFDSQNIRLLKSISSKRNRPTLYVGGGGGRPLWCNW
jgi:hypothetical protein